MTDRSKVSRTSGFPSKPTSTTPKARRGRRTTSRSSTLSLMTYERRYRASDALRLPAGRRLHREGVWRESARGLSRAGWAGRQDHASGGEGAPSLRDDLRAQAEL